MFEILNRHRAEEIEALDGIAARLLEIRQLLLCFNPLGNRLVSEHCSQIRDRIDDDPGLVAVMIDKEASVELHRIDLQFAQAAKRRIAGAEVVDGALEAEILELADEFSNPVVALDCRGFRDLKLDEAGIHVEGLADALKVRQQIRNLNRLARQVERNRKIRHIPVLPLCQNPADLFKDEYVDMVHQAIARSRSGMNSPGETIPTPGRFQRIRASAPMIFCVFRETLG